MFRKCMFEKVWVIQLKQLYLWHDCLYVQYEIYVHVQIMWSGSSISKLYTIPQYIIIKSTLSAPPVVSMGNRILVNSFLRLVWDLNCCVLLDQ